MYTYSICHPDKPQPEEKGKINKDEIIDCFKKYSWEEALKTQNNLSENEIFFSPSLEFKDLENQKSLTFSVVGEPENFVFYIFLNEIDLVDIHTPKAESLLKLFLDQKWIELDKEFEPQTIAKTSNIASMQNASSKTKKWWQFWK